MRATWTPSASSTTRARGHARFAFHNALHDEHSEETADAEASLLDLARRGLKALLTK